MTEQAAATPSQIHPARHGRDAERSALTITQAAQACGLTVRAIRYYEVLGMITPPRSPGHARIYFGETLQRLRRLAQMRQAGLTPTEIIDDDLLGDSVDAAARLQVAVRSRLARLNREQAALNALLEGTSES